MEKYYHFAGVNLVVSMPEDRMYDDDRNLAAFRIEDVNDTEQMQSPFQIEGMNDTEQMQSSNLSLNLHHFNFEVFDTLEPPDAEEVGVFPGFRVYAHHDAGDNEFGNDITDVDTTDADTIATDTTLRYIGSVQDSWEPAYIRVKHCGNQHEVQLKASQFPDKIGVKTVLTSLGAEHLVVEAGGFIFHSSYIEWDGKAILFTAPSETGKSTQADLWHELRGAQIINGDRSAIRVVDGEVLAAGIPFAGSSQYCKNRTLPLAAIVYLQQAPVTSIYRLKGIRAFRCIWEGISVNTWDKRDVEQVSELVQQVIDQVPVYQLACTPDESAVNALEQMLERSM